MTYPQPSFVPGLGWFHLFTKYTKGRELYWETSPDGVTWSNDRKLAGMGGHYQTSAAGRPDRELLQLPSRRQRRSADEPVLRGDRGLWQELDDGGRQAARCPAQRGPESGPGRRLRRTG